MAVILMGERLPLCVIGISRDRRDRPSRLCWGLAFAFVELSFFLGISLSSFSAGKCFPPEFGTYFPPRPAADGLYG